MSYNGIKVVFGGAAIAMNEDVKWKTAEDAKQVLDTLEQAGVNTVDTAQLYGDSEKVLGEAGAADRGFIIDTKALGGFSGPGTATKEAIIEGGRKSLERLRTKQVDIFYIHAPDHKTPLSDTLDGINTLYKEGAFKRFGLSNYEAKDVEAVYNTCKENGWVLPTAYQGNYSPVARKQETVLFPTLRKLGISFYAYSPLAGGFLTKTKQDIADKAGRFDPDTMLGKLYLGLYNKPAYLEALAQWQAVSEKEGVSKAELAYRWVAFNSPLKPENGDAIIIGASRLEQLSNTANFLKKGPLSKEAVDGIDKIWKTVEHEAPLDNFNG